MLQSLSSWSTLRHRCRRLWSWSGWSRLVRRCITLWSCSSWSCSDSRCDYQFVLLTMVWWTKCLVCRGGARPYIVPSSHVIVCILRRDNCTCCSPSCWPQSVSGSTYWSLDRCTARSWPDVRCVTQYVGCRTRFTTHSCSHFAFAAVHCHLL